MTGVTRVTVATLIGFVILGLGLGLGYVLDPEPFSWFMGDVILVLFGKADGTGMYW